MWVAVDNDTIAVQLNVELLTIFSWPPGGLPVRHCKLDERPILGYGHLQ